MARVYACPVKSAQCKRNRPDCKSTGLGRGRVIEDNLSNQHSSAGFSFIEILIGLAIMVMVAAVVTPAVVTTLDKTRISSSVETLQNLHQAIIDFEDDVGEYPSNLSQLTTPLTSGQVDVCSSAYSGGERNSWAGPYTTVTVQSGGYPTPLGVVAQSLFYLNTGLNIDVIAITVSDVSIEDASAVDQSIDNGDGSTTGTIQWYNPSNGFVDFGYVMLIPDC